MVNIKYRSNKEFMHPDCCLLTFPKTQSTNRIETVFPLLSGPFPLIKKFEIRIINFAKNVFMSRSTDVYKFHTLNSSSIDSMPFSEIEGERSGQSVLCARCVRKNEIISKKNCRISSSLHSSND